MVLKWKEGLKATPLLAVYWNILLRGFGVGLVGLFTPIFFFLIGKDGGGIIGGIRLVTLFLLLQRSGLVLTTIPAAKLIRRLGYRWSVLLGSMFLVMFNVLPMFMDESWKLVVAMAVLSVPSISLYWLSRHSMLAGDNKDGKFGKESGIVTLLERGGVVLSPIIGGVIAEIWGFRTLFLVGSAVIFLSSLPLFFLPHHVKDGVVSLGGFRKWILSRSKGYIPVAVVGEALEGVVTGFYWPIYMFIFIGSMSVLGGIESATMLLGSVAIFYAGKLFDERRAMGGLEDEKAYWFSSSVMCILRILRATVAGGVAVVIVDLVNKLVAPFYWVPFGGYIYLAGRKRSLTLYAYREMLYSATITWLSIVVLLIVGSSYWWWVVFGAGAVGIWLTKRIAKISNYD